MEHLQEKRGPQKAITILVIIPIVTMDLLHQPKQYPSAGIFELTDIVWVDAEGPL